MSINQIPNSTTITAFIEKNGRAPEMKNFEDVCEIADLIKMNHWKAMDTTAWSGYYMDAARAAIIDYWKAKRLAKKA
jgi:hypothetical protein